MKRILLILLMVLALAVCGGAPAEELYDVLFLRVAALPVGTAGASLQQAEAVGGLWRLAGTVRFDRLSPDELVRLLLENLHALGAAEQAAWLENAPDILAEAGRLTDPSREAGGVYEDAGVAQALASLRAEEETRRSVAALVCAAQADLLTLRTLQHLPEPSAPDTP